MSVSACRSRALALGLAALGCASLAGCGGRSREAAPRLKTIPMQATTGQGTVFSVDLSTFVTDRENGVLSYSVVSGGGSFSGSTYSNTFDTLGTFAVEFDVADPAKVTRGSFQVEVTKANLAIVRINGKNLRLFDTDTEKFLNISESSFTETPLANLPRGPIVYQRVVGSNTDLFSFDPNTRKTTTLGDSVELNEVYVGKTSQNQALFTAGTTTDTDLFLFNAITRITKTISATKGEHDRNPFVNVNDIVYYERGQNGQNDIYYYDPSTDESMAISTDPATESILGVLPNGGVVFSRRGSGGENDLFYFNMGTGVAEVGADLGATIGLQSKTYHAASTSNHVVFSAAASPTSKSLYFWNPSDGLSLAIQTGADLTYRAISEDDVVVFTVATGGQDDISLFDIPNSTPGTPTVVSNNAANETVNAVVTKSGASYVIYTRAAGPNSLHVYNVDTPGTTNITNAAGVQYAAKLANGDVVYRLLDGSAIFHLDPATATSTNASAGLGATNLLFAGAGTAAGDFVFMGTNGVQTDLYLWDLSATARVDISTTAGNDVFRAMTTAGEVIFTRVVTGSTTADLHLFDPADSTTERLTSDGSNYEVVGTYSADNS